MKYLIVAVSGILVSAALFTIPAQAGEESQKQPQAFDLQRALEVLIPKQEQPPQEQPPQEEPPQEEPKQWPLKGKIFSLRIHEKVREVYFLLKTVDKKEGFQFTLLDDDKLPIHQGWLDMLRDAFNNNWDMHVSAKPIYGGYVVYSLTVTK